MDTRDHSEQLLEAVREARSDKTTLAIQGGDTKRFYGRSIDATPLFVREHRGVLHYEPTELVLTARAGTPLAEIEALLKKHRQMLPFEPPHFGDKATFGGTIAAGLSGPRRPYAGAVRDNVLGVTLINGGGERLHFGGEVMKNVAGYDLSRLMAGSLGTLALLLEISVKVLPLPDREVTHARRVDPKRVIALMNAWASRPIPVSATWHDGENLYVRLSGTENAIRAGLKIVDGEPLDRSEVFWRTVREQDDPFFVDDTPLWRLSVPPATSPLNMPGKMAMEWNGAVRWLKTEANPSEIRHTVERVGGHATLFRGGDRCGDVFHPLSPVLHKVHVNLKRALDPEGIFNPGRMYRDI
jgi:glycolate oxidase FAD binding subunit